MAPRNRFTSIPALALGGITPGMMQIVNAIKENVELLTGGRNEADAASRAITVGAIATVRDAPVQNLTRVTASGAGFTLSGVSVASAEDHVKLINDVQTLANDVASLRATVNTLLQQMKA